MKLTEVTRAVTAISRAASPVLPGCHADVRLCPRRSPSDARVLDIAPSTLAAAGVLPGFHMPPLST